MDGLASVELMSNDPKVEAHGPKPTPNQVEKFKLIARMTKLYNPKKSPCRKLVYKKKLFIPCHVDLHIYSVKSLRGCLVEEFD